MLSLLRPAAMLCRCCVQAGRQQEGAYGYRAAPGQEIRQAAAEGKQAGRKAAEGAMQTAGEAAERAKQTTAQVQAGMNSAAHGWHVLLCGHFVRVLDCAESSVVFMSQRLSGALGAGCSDLHSAKL